MHVSATLELYYLINEIVGSSFPTGILDGHLHRVTHTRFCIDTSDSPDDNAVPEDGVDCAETCRSYFNVNLKKNNIAF
jgi:hypothetical protein